MRAEHRQRLTSPRGRFSALPDAILAPLCPAPSRTDFISSGSEPSCCVKQEILLFQAVGKSAEITVRQWCK